MNKHPRDCRVAADGDRDFPRSKDVHHIELTGREPEPILAAQRSQLEREGVQRFLPYPLNAVWVRKHGVLIELFAHTLSIYTELYISSS